MAEVNELGSGLLWWIALLPLIGSLATYVVGRARPHLAGWVATAGAVSAFAVSLLAVSSLISSGAAALSQSFGTWMSVKDFLEVSFQFRLDRLSAVMILVVTGVGSLIHLYSIGYMAEDPSRARFFAYLNLFLFFMLVLVLGANLPLLFVGWEGVGLCSYLLIGFWFTNPSYAAAGRKAFVVNRIGDAGFLLGMFVLLSLVGTLDFVSLQKAIASTPHLSASLLALASLSLFIGATGKSAQIPLFVWLPDAMAGPTPVSALIHAATMVTAGVYLMARMHFLLAVTPAVLPVIGLIAALTAFVAASTALVQNDIKKVLAYSTVSQLGFMFLAVSAGAYWVAIFHVITHAFFKACLFLGAGSVIHSCHHEQDMRHMGGLIRKMPVTGAAYIASTLAIAGIFPLAGYFSKHAILEAFKHSTLVSGTDLGEAIFILVEITAFLTAFYMGRSVMLTFFGSYRGHAHPHEAPSIMTVPVAILGVLAVIGGIGLVHVFSLEHFLQPVLSPEAHGTAGGHGEGGILSALMGSLIGVAGIVLAWLLYGPLRQIPGRLFAASGPIGRLLQHKYLVDELYQLIIIRPLAGIARGLWKIVDQGIVDGAVNGTAAFVEINGEVARYTQTGQTRHYVLMMFLGAVVLIGFFLVR